MARDHRPHWIAGPIGYKQTTHGVYPALRVAVSKWEFIGLTAGGELRRWHLCFSTETRKFTANTLTVGTWEKAHTQQLADFYRPSAVLRSMLPKGSVTVAMRAMLPAEQVAEVTALAMRGGT